MKKDRQGDRGQEPLPLLYVLPGDLPTVKVMAYAEALEAAYEVIDQRLDVEQDLRAMAIQLSLVYEQQVLDGKQGTNDKMLFWQTFIDEFLARYPEALDALKSGSYAVAPGLPKQERMALFYQYAQAHTIE